MSYKKFVLICTLKEETLLEMAGFLILTLMSFCFIHFNDFTALAVKCPFLMIKRGFLISILLP
jgi:hypothetical protein